MGIRIDYRGKIRSYGFPKRLESELIALFEDNVDRIHSQTRRSRNALSVKTQEYRLVGLCAAIRELRNDGGYAIESPWSIRHKHVAWLVTYWVKKGQTAGTIENKLTYLRAIAHWMGKPNLVLTLEGYVDRKAAGLKRYYTAQDDLSWSAKGIDIEAEIRRVEAEDVLAGVQLRLMWKFGLRVEEAFKFRPVRDLRDGAIYVSEGSKGGRSRPVPITRPKEQYDLLEIAARFTNSRTGSTIPDAHSYDSWSDHFYDLLAKHGVTKDGRLGRTAHGLRHEYLQGLYSDITGALAPIKEGSHRIDREVHREGQRRVAEAAGHSRVSKANAYLSTYATQEAKRRPVISPKQAVHAVAEHQGNKSRAALSLGISRRALYRLFERYESGDQS
ncbi:topoisomerase (plasmid) [Cupriavidus pauculus]|uniref:Topoisomerase n=1 Tax=Cupriavidus pauculus TaxID=82633 RepID=A0A5P2HAC9_9BURK|nr:integrase domain-containing protein [Cupriavidus pauculus]QET04050.1 topoisomerase [Cupriavidus pauculus]